MLTATAISQPTYSRKLGSGKTAKFKEPMVFKCYSKKRLKQAAMSLPEDVSQC
jgi:hypothetical protein